MARAPEWSPTPDLLTAAASVCCARPVGFQEKAARETDLRPRPAAAAAVDIAAAAAVRRSEGSQFD